MVLGTKMPRKALAFLSMRSNTRCHALKKKFKVVHKFILYCGALLAISLIIVDIFYLLMTLA